MSVEISFGGTCRDIAKLPQSDGDLRTFYESFLAPAIYQGLRGERTNGHWPGLGHHPRIRP
ncbi:hypothetical protein BH09PSE1_BH09PSE1_21780 [soil metagenome]